MLKQQYENNPQKSHIG